MLRSASLPGLVLAASALAVANVWKAFKDALPKVGHSHSIFLLTWAC